MRFMEAASLAAFLSLSALAGERVDCGIADMAYPPGSATASMLNGEFWLAASPDVRMFYVGAATEAVAAAQPPIEHFPTVGWTYPQTVEWITAFYSSDDDLRRVPVAVTFSYALRSRDGESRETLKSAARAFVRRLQKVDP